MKFADVSKIVRICSKLPLSTLRAFIGWLQGSLKPTVALDKLCVILRTEVEDD